MSYKILCRSINGTFVYIVCVYIVLERVYLNFCLFLRLFVCTHAYINEYKYNITSTILFWTTITSLHQERRNNITIIITIYWWMKSESREVSVLSIFFIDAVGWICIFNVYTKGYNKKWSRSHVECNIKYE